jgi:hypothetical protein
MHHRAWKCAEAIGAPLSRGEKSDRRPKIFFGRPTKIFSPRRRLVPTQPPPSSHPAPAQRRLVPTPSTQAQHLRNIFVTFASSRRETRRGQCCLTSRRKKSDRRPKYFSADRPKYFSDRPKIDFCKLAPMDRGRFGGHEFIYNFEVSALFALSATQEPLRNFCVTFA